jgi:osmotically-inducible protein OsmY
MTTDTLPKVERELVKSDHELQLDVLRQLEWVPRVDAARVAVAVQDGVVTLSGRVASYAQRRAAEQAAKSVFGVRAVVNKIEVEPTDDTKVTDEDIAAAAVSALKWNIFVPARNIKVIVDHGWVTLEGIVNWQFQKEAAEDAMRNLSGVIGVTNRIVVRPRVDPGDIKSRIEEAFRRHAVLDARRIAVEVDGRNVILRGDVGSWVQRDVAERAAWSAPGVERVENHIAVRPVRTVTAAPPAEAMVPAH